MAGVTARCLNLADRRQSGRGPGESEKGENLMKLVRSSWQQALACAVAFAVVAGATVATAAKPVRPITKPKYDPSAERVALFEGIEQGSLQAKVIPNDEFGGKVLIENKSDKPLTVELPDSFVGVQVLTQFGAGGGLGGGGLGGGGLGGGGLGGGGQQQTGGGFGGGLGGLGQQGGLGGGGGGAGFFSVPPEKVVSVPYVSVCLEHGKPEPTNRSTYMMVPVDEATENPALRELIRLVGTGRLSPQAAQAAAWHLTDSMSWQELAAKQVKRIGRTPLPYFSANDLHAAQAIVAQASALAREKAKNAPAEVEEPQKPRRIR